MKNIWNILPDWLKDMLIGLSYALIISLIAMQFELNKEMFRYLLL